MLAEFAEMLSALSAEGVEYVVVGGYAVGAHLEPRATKDLDILVRPSGENAARVLRALRRFRAPLMGLTAKDLGTPGLIFQIGVAPRRIDLLTSIDGVDFDEAWSSRIEITVSGLAAPMRVIGRDALIANKRAVGRPQDLADVAKLEQLPRDHGTGKKKKKKTVKHKKR